MYKTTDFKKAITKDYFINRVYCFDSILSGAIVDYLLLQEHNIQNGFPANKHQHLFKIENTIELTQKILSNENFFNVNVRENTNNNESNCSFQHFIINFCKDHLNNKEIAFHEMAHFFAALITHEAIPSHHVLFMSLLEWLLDKYGFLPKVLFENLVKKHHKTYKSKLPYIKDFLSVTELTSEQCLKEIYFLEQQLWIEDSNVFALTPYVSCKADNISRQIYELEDVFITFVSCKKTNTHKKFIVKKLDYQKRKKEIHSDLIFSPIYKTNANYSYGISLSKTKSKYFEFLSTHILIKNNDKEILNTDILHKLIDNTFLNFKEKNKDSIIIDIRKYSNSIVIGFDPFYFFDIDIKNFIKLLKNEIKKNNLTYKSINTLTDFDNLI